MKAPTLHMTGPVPVAEIDTRDRIRPVSEAGVEAILASIRDTGVMKDAIHVRRKKNGVLALIAGAHRLEAAKRQGWETIEAKVWVDVTDDWSRLMEIDDNLAGADLTPLDTAVFLARRKEVYERLHPEARAAVGAQLAAKRWDAADMMSVASFAAVTAEKFGLTDRHVRRLVAAGARLGPQDVALLRKGAKPVTLADLGLLAKMDTVARYDAVQLFAEGRVKSIAEAQRAKATEKPQETAFDARLKSLLTGWERAGMTVRRAFVAELLDDLVPLVADAAAARAEGGAKE